MKNIGLALAAILMAILLISVPVQAAGVNNVTLSAVGASGVPGMATTIVGDVAGSNPYQNVEVNMRLDRAAPANMVYEGWLMDSKSNYNLSLGAFKGNRLTFRQSMVNVPYDSIAVSLEQANNTNPQPTTIISRGAQPGTSVAAADFRTMAVLPEDESFQMQSIQTRFNMTSDQVSSLRMMGYSYTDIAMVGNVAARCNRMPTEIATMLSQGQTWDQIAAACNTSTAMLFTPMPMQAVAGSQQEMGMPSGTMMSTPMVRAPMYYRMYPNGTPVITEQDWMSLSRRGYTWQDVAVAANISMQTGERPEDLLRMTRLQGMTWSQIAIERGLNSYDTLRTGEWPFSRTGEALTQTERDRMMQSTPSSVGGAGTTGTMQTTPAAPSPSGTPGTISPSEPSY